MIYFFNCNYKNSNNTKNIGVQCNWMGYACGDCYSEYKIIDVIKGDSLLNGNSILNKDLSVSFKNKNEEKIFRDAVAKCTICYQYYFWGTLENQKNNGLKILIDSCTFTLNDSCCSLLN